MDVIHRIVVVSMDGREEMGRAYHVWGYVGMVILLVERSVIQGLDVQVTIVDVHLDGIQMTQSTNHVIHSVGMDMLLVQNNVR
jgi:hypothetical protein